MPCDGQNAGREHVLKVLRCDLSQRTLFLALPFDLWGINPEEAHLLAREPECIAIDYASVTLLVSLAKVPVMGVGMRGQASGQNTYGGRERSNNFAPLGRIHKGTAIRPACRVSDRPQKPAHRCRNRP